MVPLKVTTDSSLLKSLIKIPDLIAFLVQNNIKACAICDDELFGTMEFYFKCKEAGIKPILGLEVKIQDHKIYLYPKNYAGLQKLFKINTLKFTKALEITDVIDYNIKIIIPYENSNLYTEISNKENVYIGYQNEMNKKNALILSSNVVKVNDVRALTKKEVPYLKYLQDLGGDFTFLEDSYLNLNTTKEENEEQEGFIQDINIEIPLNRRFIPVYKENSYEYLRLLALKGLEKRFNKNVPKNYYERLEMELQTIKEMGFVDYFLIVYDYVLFAKKKGIMVGPGRGSAAGSLISYAIGITEIDPIKYDLLFARFLNPYRKKMPDIDIDFEDERRHEVIAYVKEKYGEKKVALGLTFNNYKSKLVLRDLAKVLKIDSALLEKFIKCIDASLSLKENLQKEDVKKYLALYKDLKELYNVAMHLENIKKNISTHAAGVVICSEDIDNIIPVYDDGSFLKTGITMDYLESFGLLKMDFLGLRNLTLINKMVKNIPNFNLNSIPLDDMKVYRYLQSGKVNDLFQFESRYASFSLYKLQVKNFNELAIAVALVRPGPNKQMDEYIKNKNSLKYDVHPALKSILDQTYGIMIFQEQVMQILSVIAGYSGPEADNVRIAMSKKKREVLLEEKEKFINGALKNGYDKAFAEDLFNKILKFGEYSFNKSHSVCYALIVYELAYLKVNYNLVYNIVMLEETKNGESRKNYLNSLREQNIKILKPSINLSTLEYKFKDNKLLLPLNIIKNLPEKIIENILEKRPFSDIYDFILKCSSFLTPALYDILVLSGALDCFKYPKKSLIENKDALFNYALMGDYSLAKPEITYEKEYSDEILREHELNLYGMFISNHPCQKYQNVIKAAQAKDFLFKNIKMALMIEKITVIKTKKGDKMAFIMASDETGKVELTLFPNVFLPLTDLKESSIILINGKSSKRFDKYQIVVNSLKVEVEK